MMLVAIEAVVTLGLLVIGLGLLFDAVRRHHKGLLLFAAVILLIDLDQAIGLAIHFTGGTDAALLDQLSTLATIVRSAAAGCAIVLVLTYFKNRTGSLPFTDDSERLRFIGERTSNGVVMIDRQGRVEWINERYTELTGWTLADLKGKKPLEINAVNPEDELAKVSASLASGRGFSTQLTQRKKDGGLITLAITAEPIRDAKGEVVGYIGIDTDVTEQIELKNAHADAAQKLALFAETSTEGFWVWDLETGLFDYTSDAVHELFGCTRDELMHTPGAWMSRVHEDDKPKCLTHKDTALKDGRFEDEYRIKDPSGEIRWIRCRGTVVRTGPDAGKKMVGSTEDITAQHALAESEARFHDLSQVSHELFYSRSDHSGKPSNVSPSLERITGRTRESFLNGEWRWADIIHPDDLQDVEDASERLRQVGSKQIVYRIIHTDGSIRWLRDSAYCVEDEKNNTKLTGGIVVDITLERLAQESAEHAQRMYHAITQNARDVIWSFDELRQQIELITPSGRALLGVPVEDLLAGRTKFIDLIHPDDRDAFNTAIAELNEGRSYAVELRILRPDGTERLVRESGSPVFDANGRLIRSIGVIVDLTKEHELLGQLASSEERFRQIADNADEMIWAYDEITGKPEFVSPAIEKWLGYKAEDIMSRRVRWTDIVHPEDRPAFERSVQQLKHGGKINLEYRAIHADGSIRWFRDTGFPVYDEARCLVRTVGVASDITLSKQMASQLAESERKLDAAVRGAELGTWEYLPETDELRVNSQWHIMLGYDTPQALTGTLEDWDSRLHPEDRHEIERVTELLDANEQKVADITVRLRHADGSWRYVHDRFSVIERDASGKPTRYAGTHQDVTDQVVAEKRLQEQRDRAALATEAANLGAWTWDVARNHATFDNRCCDMLGLPAGSLDGANTVYEQRYHPADLLLSRKRFPTLGSWEPGSYEITRRVRHADGSYRWIHSTGRIMERDADGNPTKMAGVHRDVTQERLAARKLAESEASYQRILEMTSDAVWVLDREGLTVAHNARLVNLLGLDPDSLTGTDMGEYLAEGEHLRGAVSFEQWTAQNPSTRQQRFARSDGEIVTALVSMTPKFTADGLFDGAIAMLTDVTEKLATEESMHRAQKLEAIGLMARGLAHDFRNLLSAITGHVSLAEATLDLEHPASDSLRTVAAAAEQAERVTTSLLKFANPSPQSTDDPVVSLGEALAPAVDLLRRTLPKSIRIVTDLGDRDPLVRILPASVQQLVINLALNARDAMPSGGEIAISIEPAAQDPVVRLRMTDQGPGIPAEIRDRVFDPFFTDKTDGTGLGLSIVQSIASQAKGTVRIEDAPGGGACFVIEFPAASELDRERRLESPATIEPKPKATALLVLKEGHVRQLIAADFRSRGWHLIEVSPDGFDPAALGGRVLICEPATVNMLELDLHPNPIRIVCLAEEDERVDPVCDCARVVRKPFAIRDLLAFAAGEETMQLRIDSERETQPS